MKTKKNKKINIFGGSGFLGNSLIKFLIKMDIEIVLFTRKASPEKLIKKYKSNSNIKIINWNVSNYELIEKFSYYLESLDIDKEITLCSNSIILEAEMLFEEKRLYGPLTSLCEYAKLFGSEFVEIKIY